MAFIPKTVLENVRSLTPGWRLPVAGFNTALTEMRMVMSAETNVVPVHSANRRQRKFFVSLERIEISRLLEGHQDEHKAAALVEGGHGLADDGALGLAMVADFHAVAGNVRRGDQVPGFHGPGVRVHPAI